MSAEYKPAPAVAILNGNPDMLDLMQQALEDEGYNVATALVAEIKRGRVDFVEFMRRHRPLVIVVDLPPPFEENMTFFRLLRDTHSLDDKCVLLTTTNKKALEDLTGVKGVLEVLGKPFDLAELRRLVREKVEACDLDAA